MHVPHTFGGVSLTQQLTTWADTAFIFLAKYWTNNLAIWSHCISGTLSYYAVCTGITETRHYVISHFRLRQNSNWGLSRRRLAHIPLDNRNVALFALNKLHSTLSRLHRTWSKLYCMLSKLHHTLNKLYCMLSKLHHTLNKLHMT